MDKSSPSICSNSEAAEEEAAEETWELLYFHWSGHAMLFTGAFIATYVTGDMHLTGGAVLLFVASGIIGFAIAQAPFRQYAMAYGLYTLFSAFLAAGWWASYATGNHLYTALGMLVYIVSPVLFHLAYNVREKQGKQ